MFVLLDFRSREGTNLEYLKNVVLCYLRSESHSSKVQMFNAIATILQFTPKEVGKLSRRNWVIVQINLLVSEPCLFAINVGMMKPKP